MLQDGAVEVLCGSSLQHHKRSAASIDVLQGICKCGIRNLLFDTLWCEHTHYCSTAHYCMPSRHEGFVSSCCVVGSNPLKSPAALFCMCLLIKPTNMHQSFGRDSSWCTGSGLSAVMWCYCTQPMIWCSGAGAARRVWLAGTRGQQCFGTTSCATYLLCCNCPYCCQYRQAVSVTPVVQDLLQHIARLQTGPGAWQGGWLEHVTHHKLHTGQQCGKLLSPPLQTDTSARSRCVGVMTHDPGV